MALFEIIRRYPGSNIATGKYTPASAPAKRGLALAVKGSPVDGSLFVEADGQSTDGVFVGFLTRDTVTGGPVLGDHIFPGRLELPFTAGDEVTVEKADAVEAEGNDFLVSGTTGAITGSTAIGSDLSFVDGKFRVAQSGDTVYYKLAARLPVEESYNMVRIRAEVIR